ncbi:MAG: 1,4-alpha-glucan branching protein GlgB [Clostridia bacterium]|nr:1,4-alpha-glucan branching protein GlgB [Clostridia bacterium]
MYGGFFKQSSRSAPGSRPTKNGFSFCVWAPNAVAVSVVGNFNGWDPASASMRRTKGGLWRTEISDLPSGELYKYRIVTNTGDVYFRADPCGRYAELRPGTASATWRSTYRFRHDRAHLRRLSQLPPRDSRPLSIYEVHAGSWREGTENYRDLADALALHAKQFGFTHIELLPVKEFPFDGSWGYQTTGYFAPTSRWGTPDDFKYFVDTLHNAGIGVILDWVPAHFPRDEAGLRIFDGHPLFEHPDPAVSEHPVWGTLRFNFESEYVRDFLISSALWWFDEYHIDGLRVDAVSAILYRDMSFPSPETLVPSGIEFLKELNSVITQSHPHALMIAEECSDYKGITVPVEHGGLGFTYKWNMGWMNDTLKYIETDPLFRSSRHGLLTFPMMYAFDESFILPLSHDECVHGKKSFLNKMPGEYNTKFDSLRMYLTYMYTTPGKKLFFMGTEFGQFIEWRYYEPLEWKLMAYESHRKLHRFTQTLTRFYRRHPALWADDRSWSGFEWSNADDAIFDVYSYIRMGQGETLLVVVNTTPTPKYDYYVGTDVKGRFRLVLNTDAEEFYGSGMQVKPSVSSAPIRQGNHSRLIKLDLPPCSVLIYRLMGSKKEQ